MIRCCGPITGRSTGAGAGSARMNADSEADTTQTARALNNRLPPIRVILIRAFECCCRTQAARLLRCRYGTPQAGLSREATTRRCAEGEQNARSIFTQIVPKSEPFLIAQPLVFGSEVRTCRILGTLWDRRF